MCALEEQRDIRKGAVMHIETDKFAENKEYKQVCKRCMQRQTSLQRTKSTNKSVKFWQSQQLRLLKTNIPILAVTTIKAAENQHTNTGSHNILRLTSTDLA